MRVSLPAGDPLLAERVVRDSRVLIWGTGVPNGSCSFRYKGFRYGSRYGLAVSP